VSNTIITTANLETGAVLNVSLVVNGLVESFPVSLEFQSGSGSTSITTADNVSHAVEQWLEDANGVLEVVQATGTLGDVGDNQLRYLTTYDAQDNVTHLQLQFDTNSAFGTGQTTAGAVVAMDFEGNVQNLIPAALQYVGP
jgi:hypothetical protein